MGYVTQPLAKQNTCGVSKLCISAVSVLQVVGDKDAWGKIATWCIDKNEYDYWSKQQESCDSWPTKRYSTIRQFSADDTVWSISLSLP